jgi:NAD(P)-dependent dehydrogenase (short-subunit alcohol dehydrogenase family)
VTGAGSGIGRATVQALASEGAHLAVTVVNPTENRTDFAAVSGESSAERLEGGQVSEPKAVVVAGQDPSMASEIDIYRQDKVTGF